MLARLSALLAVAGVAACTVADSSLYEARISESRCQSQLGQYVLPKSVLRIVINEKDGQDADGKTKRFNVIESLSQEHVPLNEMRYCLEYKPSPVSHDKVTAKTDEKNFLSFVSSDAADQTAYIVKTLIRAIFVGISQNPSFRNTPGATPDVKVADLSFDPFDIHETAAKNVRLRELGFCLVLDGFTFGGGDTAQSYCENPGKYLRRKTEYVTKYREILDTTIVGYSQGVLYRPRVPYTLTVYTNQDPDRRGSPWRPRQSDVFDMENISPFAIMRLDRTLFAVKRIGLVFSVGELKNACVFKSSEAIEAVTIPVEIVKSVVALPTSILQVRFDNVTGARELAEAENNVIRAQIAYLEYLNTRTPTNPNPTKPAHPGAMTIGQTSKFNKLEFNDTAQLGFWDSICNQPGTAEPRTGKVLAGGQ